MGEEIAAVAEMFPFVTGVFVVDVADLSAPDSTRLFVGFESPLSQRDVVAFHSKLMTYVSEDGLPELNLFEDARVPKVVEKRGRRIELSAADRAAALMMLEQRARARREESPTSALPPPLLQLLEPEGPPPDGGPLYLTVGGFVMPIGARRRLAEEAREAIVAEAVAWHYSQEEPALRSTSLADFAPDTHGVMGLVVRRAGLLRALAQYPAARLEMRGRLLCCQLGRSRPRIVVPEVFEPVRHDFRSNGLPAWDLWCWSREDYLVAWIPRYLEHHVAVQAELCPGRYRWLSFPRPEPEYF